MRSYPQNNVKIRYYFSTYPQKILLRVVTKRTLNFLATVGKFSKKFPRIKFFFGQNWNVTDFFFHSFHHFIFGILKKFIFYEFLKLKNLPKFMWDWFLSVRLLILIWINFSSEMSQSFIIWFSSTIINKLF